MCYLDKTFCSFWIKCKNGHKCHRALTPTVLIEAEKWMKNAPICEFSEKPKCYEEDKYDYD